MKLLGICNLAPLLTKSVFLRALILALISAVFFGCANFQGPLAFQRSGIFSPGDNSFNRSFAWPVKKPKLTQRYINKSSYRHQGIDLGGSKGKGIYASAAGYVVYVGSGFTGYGKTIIIEHDHLFATLYGHLSGFVTREKKRVHKGQLIGYMGNTGRSRGVHLHFELIKDRKPVDPMRYLPARR